MKAINRTFLLAFFLLATLTHFAYSQNSIVINVYYPVEHVCKNCSLLFGNSLDNFAVYDNISNPLPSARLNYQGDNLFTSTINLNSSVSIGTFVSITPVYSLDARIPLDIVDPMEALKELLQIELNCFNLILGVKVRALGQQTNITVQEGVNVVSIYPYFCTQEGKLDASFRFFSPQFNDSRQVYALVPPSLLENPISRYVNVMVLNDGQFANWIAQDVYSLINNGEIAETLIIGVSSNYQRNYELTPTVCNSQCEDCASFGKSGGGPLYVNFCADTVIPQILAKFNLYARPNNISMGGYSLGGLMGCWAPYLRPDVFSSSYCGSPTLSWNCEEYAKQLVPSTSFTPSAVYIDYGSAEGEIQSIPATDSFNALAAQGMIPNADLWMYSSYGDFHDTNSWKRRFWRAATDLLRYPALN